MVDLSSSLYMSTFTRVFCYSNLHKKIPSPWSAWPCILRYPDIPSSAESHQQIELHLGKSDKTSHRCVHLRAPCSQCICWPPEGGERLKECCWKIENQQIETDMIWYDMIWWPLDANWIDIPGKHELCDLPPFVAATWSTEPLPPLESKFGTGLWKIRLLKPEVSQAA